jgi:hypothetical protein
MMWIHGLAIAGAVLGCAAWGMFQLWIAKRDAECRFQAGCCGGRNCKRESEEFNTSEISSF